MEEIWEERYPSFLKKEFSLHEYLLSSLGQASRVCPYVEKSLRSSRPAGYELDVKGAYEFLTEKAKIFERWGFRVILPSWWTSRGTKLWFAARANVKAPTMRALNGLSLAQVVQFDWEISLLGKKIQTLSLIQRDWEMGSRCPVLLICPTSIVSNRKK